MNTDDDEEEGLRGHHQHEGVVVCKKFCFAQPPFVDIIDYAGDVPPSVLELNYREISMLSPVKLLTQMTRKRTLTNGKIGHQEIKGSIYMKHSFEFANVVFGGMLGLNFRRGIPQHVKMYKVRRAFEDLQHTHPLLAYCDYTEDMANIVEYHIRKNNQHIRVNDHWRDQILMPSEGINPNAANVPLNNLMVGEQSIFVTDG